MQMDGFYAVSVISHKKNDQSNTFPPLSLFKIKKMPRVRLDSTKAKYLYHANRAQFSFF